MELVESVWKYILEYEDGTPVGVTEGAWNDKVVYRRIGKDEYDNALSK